MKKHILFGSLFLVLLSCSKSSVIIDKKDNLQGKWEWVKSSGGISGSTETPITSNKLIVLEISGSKVKFYENGTLKNSNSYTIQTKKSIMGGEKKMIIYVDKTSQSFDIIDNKLFLTDECYDCYQSEYIKKQLK